MKVFWTVAELLEERNIPWWERWFWKTDIFPNDKNFDAPSWAIGRATINRILFFLIFLVFFFGLAIVFVEYIVILQSLQQAIFATGIVGISIVWAWGTIGILDLLGFDIRQRVYVLAAFTNCIIQGESFGLHKLQEYNRTGDWKRAQVVDVLIFNTAMVAVFGFFTLWSFKLLSIRELGMISASGVIYLYFLVKFFVPALAKFPPKEPGVTRVGAAYSSVIQFLVRKCYSLSKVPALAYTLLILAMMATSGYKIFYQKQLIVGSTPGDIIKGTFAEKGIIELNRPGEMGCDALSVLVEPMWQEENGMYSPRFIARLSELQEDVLENAKGARRSMSVALSIRKLSMKMYGKPLPDTEEELNRILWFMKHYPKIPEVVVEQNWFHNGARLVVSAALNNSIEQGNFVREVERVAAKYTDLKFSPFEKVALYHIEDKEVWEGKVKNVIYSQGVVVIFCFLIILMKSRMLGSRMLNPWIGSVSMSTPFLFALSLVALIMVFFRLPLDVITAVVSVLAISTAIDFSIYYVDAYQVALLTADREEAVYLALKTEGETIINDIILNGSGFLPLWLLPKFVPGFAPLSRLGWIMVVIVLSCGIGSLIIMPSLLRHAVRKEEKYENIKLHIGSDVNPCLNFDSS
jgi:predicted RND superfamily exporter protein